MNGNAVITVTLLPAQPGNFIASSAVVYQGATGVVYTVPSDLSVTYSWSYTGTGVTITGTGNSVTLSFSASATSGTLSVTANNILWYKHSKISRQNCKPSFINRLPVAGSGLTQPTDNTIEFDVFLLDTDPSQSFQLASLQLGFLFSSGIYSGGSLTVTINNAGSGLLASQQFTASPSVVASLTGYPDQTLIRLAGNTPPGTATVLSFRLPETGHCLLTLL